MATYETEQKIYAKQLKALLAAKPHLDLGIAQLRELRREAMRLRRVASMPGFVSPYVGYLPAFGSEARARAYMDYFRLRPLIDNSELLSRFIENEIDLEQQQFEALLQTLESGEKSG